MKDLNAGCAHDVSDDDRQACDVYGYLLCCPKDCEYFENWLGKKNADIAKDIASLNSNMAL